MKNKYIVPALIALNLSLVGCATNPVEAQKPTPPQAAPSIEETSAAKASIAAESSAKPSFSPTPSASTTRTEVIWSDYDPGTQGEIDRMTNAGDCLGISSYFGMTTATEEAVKTRTGHGNEAITQYLNEALAIAKCN